MRNLLKAVICACLMGMSAWAQSGLNCPGNPNKLSCQINTTFRTASSNLSAFAPTLSTQLNQLPLAAAATGSGIAIVGGIPTVSTDTLGSILTDRGDTVGKYKFYASFSYQRFWFDSIDGVRMKHFPTAIKKLQRDSQGGLDYIVTNNRFDLTDDQFTVLGTLGLTDRIDVSVIIPFSKITFKTQAAGNEYFFNMDGSFNQTQPLGTTYYPGSASGIGDVLINGKVNVISGEKSRVAFGGEVRFPTGDEFNYLGSGAYGFKPYIIYSRSGRVTPHINFGYQWNSSSAIYPDPNGSGNLRLPDSLQYSAGADVGITKRWTAVADWIGQYVLDGPRVLRGTQFVTGDGQSTGMTPTSAIPTQCSAQWSCQTIQSKTDPSGRVLTEAYAMNNVSVGIKLNVFRGLLITGNALIAIDDNGLRAKVVPLVGVSYKF
jgi:hypothetical protein